MRNKKSVLLLLVIFLLLASSLYLVYVIQDGGNPLTILNLRASNDEDLALQDFQNDPLGDTTPVDQQVDALLANNGTDPTPTIEFTSTSPTPAEIAVTTTVTPTNTPDDTNDPIPTETLTPTPVQPTPTPETTPVSELPVAGINDYFNPVWIGGGVLVLLAFLL